MTYWNLYFTFHHVYFLLLWWPCLFLYHDVAFFACFLFSFSSPLLIIFSYFIPIWNSFLYLFLCFPRPSIIYFIPIYYSTLQTIFSFLPNSSYFSIFILFFSSIQQDGLLHDLAHYFAQFLWILANIVWAAGDFLYSDNDHPYALFDMYDNRKWR